MQGLRQDGRQCRLVSVRLGETLEFPDRAGAFAVEPGDDGRVVRRSVGEGRPGQPAPRCGAQGSGATDLLQGDAVVRRRGEHTHVLMVLGRGPYHRRSADIDELDGGVRGEGVEVDDDQVDPFDAVGLQVGQMLGLGPIGEDAAVDLWVEGLDPAAQHLGRTRHLRHLAVCDAGLAQLGRRVPAGHQLPAQSAEPLGQLHQPFLVVDRKQRPHNTMSSSAPFRFGDRASAQLQRPTTPGWADLTPHPDRGCRGAPSI